MSISSAAPVSPRMDGDRYRWDRLGSRPRRGWVLADVEDLEEPSHECEACGFPEVRYVHHLRHPAEGGRLAVGCVCAEHLTGDYAGHREAERALRNRQSRLHRLLNPARWPSTRNGSYRNKYRGHRLVLYRSRFAEGWRINVDDRPGRRDHPTRESAIAAAFRFLDPPDDPGIRASGQEPPPST